MSGDLINQPTGDYLIQAFDGPTGVPNSSFQLLAGSSVTVYLFMYQPAGNIGNLFPEVKLFLNGPAGTPICSVTGSTALPSTMDTLNAISLTCAPTSNVVLTPNDRYYLWVGVQSTVTPGVSTQAEMAVGRVQRGSGQATLWLPLPVPHIINITPSNALPGTGITISGFTFGASQGSATINGEALNITAWSDTSISAVLPSDATSGNIVVTTGGGAQSSGCFFVLSPVISSISPASGLAGSQITITGSNFEAAQGALHIGQQDMSVVAWTDTSVVATIPPGAVTDNIVLQTNHLLYSNAMLFTVVTPPAITASISPAPNANGWNNTTTSVTFTCVAGSAAIVACPGPQIVSTEGAGQVVSGTVTDAAGNTATANVTLNIDKTGPILISTSPLYGDSVSSASIAITGTISDPLSGASTVLCNGSAGVINGGTFSCNVTLNGGANLVVLRATDSAGNVGAGKLELFLSGVLPAPVNLSVTPNNPVMPMGGTQDLTAFANWLPANCNGCSGPIISGPRPDAVWSVSDSTIATLVTNDDGTATLTGVTPGTVTVTATVQSVSANATVNVETILPGTVLWFPASTAGTGFVAAVQAQSVSGAPDLFNVESGTDSNGQPMVVVRAYTTQGQELWATQLAGNSLFMNVVPDTFGGVLLDFVRGVGGLPKLVDLDGKTGVKLWEYVHQSGLEIFAGPLGRELALSRDGKIYMRELSLDSNTRQSTSSLVSVDGATGVPATIYTVRQSTAQLISCGGQVRVIPNPFQSSAISNPVIAPDGTIFATTLDYQEVDNFPCGGGETLVSPGATISLVKVSPDTASTPTVTPLHALSSPLADGSFPVVGLFDILPDNNGSAYAPWGFSSSRNESVNEVHLAHGSADILLPLQYDNVSMVLGDQSTLFAANSAEIVAMDLGGGTKWTALAPSGQTLHLLAASAGGGLVAKYVDDTINSGETVARFDMNGVSSLDTWTSAAAANANSPVVTGLQYFGGDAWLANTMMISSGAPVEFSDTDWFETYAGGTNQAAQHINVTGASTSGANQSAIVSALRGIKTILDADAQSQTPKYADCRTWLGANSSGLMQLYLTGDNGHSYNIGHAAIWWGDKQKTSAEDIGAFTGLKNADGTPIQGLPSVGFATTVNDNGGFFNQRSAKGLPWEVGTRKYPGNGLRAQAAILLHELSHALSDGQAGSAGFQHDMGQTNAGRSNDKLVDQHCRKAIEDLDNWFWIETPWLLPGALNTAYSSTLTARGGVGPYTWAVTQGTLPQGLTLNGTMGVISGTPTASGVASFTVQVTDSTAAPHTRTASEQYSIAIQ